MAKAKTNKADAKKLNKGEVAPQEEAPRRPLQVKFFSQEDLREIELLQLRAENARQATELFRGTVDRFAREAHEKLRQLQEDLGRKNEEFQRRAKDLHSLYERLETTYGVSMKALTYDPVSGRITENAPVNTGVKSAN